MVGIYNQGGIDMIEKTAMDKYIAQNNTVTKLKVSDKIS